MNLSFLIKLGIILFLLTGCVTSKSNFEVYKKELNKYSAMSEEEQIEAIKKDGENLRYIENPSELVQMFAVKQNGHLIRHIKNPIEKVQLEVVKKNGQLIGYINNPSEIVQLEAVKQDRFAFEKIKDPSEVIAKQAIRLNGYALKYIKNPTEQEQLIAVKADGKSIQYVNNPSEAVQLEAIKSSRYFIEYIKNPTESTISELLKKIEKIRTSRKIKDFRLKDKHVQIQVIDDKTYNISNSTTQFITLNTISFYYGNEIYSTEDIINLPPNSSKELKFINKDLIINNMKPIKFGFAVEYSLGNGMNISLYDVNQYKITDFIYNDGSIIYHW